LASTIGSGVRIAGFGWDTFSGDVLEGLVHKSSVTSLVSVAVGTVDDGLFREGD
jgi:hypothetical protein